MATLLETIAPTIDAHAGVKRSLYGNPTGLPSNDPGFRGISNEPGNAIKAPKLNNGNRPSRGTNITIPYARVTPVESINVFSGRLSPGDLVFIKRDPLGYVAAPASMQGNFTHRPDPLDAHSLGSTVCMRGLNAVNNELCGDFNGSRVWQIGLNLVQDAGGLSELRRSNPWPNIFERLSVLSQYSLDGVIMSSDAQQAHQVTAYQNDAVVFNVAIKGPAQTNNGFMSYDSHEASPLYARLGGAASTAADPVNLTVTSQYAQTTWHGRTGANDYVAALTNTFTEFPKQMFDRKARITDRCYVILRAYNLKKEIERRKLATGRDDIASNIKVMEDDGVTEVKSEDYRDLWFVQYMTTTSRYFQQHKYIQTQYQTYPVDDPADPFKIYEVARDEASLGKPFSIVHSNGGFEKVYTEKKRKLPVSVPPSVPLPEKDRLASVRGNDIENVVGAWHLGTIIDTNSSQAAVHQHGPVAASYRMTVNVDVKWLPYKPDLDNTQGQNGKSLLRMPMSRVDKVYKQKNSDQNPSEFRKYIGTVQTRTLCELEALACSETAPASAPASAPAQPLAPAQAPAQAQPQAQTQVPTIASLQQTVPLAAVTKATIPSTQTSAAQTSLSPGLSAANPPATRSSKSNMAQPATSASTFAATPAATPSPATSATSATAAATAAVPTATAAPAASPMASAPAASAAARQKSATAGVAPITESVLRRAAAGSTSKKATESSSVVSEVFDRLMGGSTATAGTSRASTGAGGIAGGAVSPTPSQLSSESESAPKTFTRRRQGGS